MLVLGLNYDEWLTIGEARLKVVRDPANPRRLRIIIDAPREVSVSRSFGSTRPLP